MSNRESFKSRLGFILISAGCAVGIGNVWKFPYVTGQNGGGIFILFYLFFLISVGVPILTMEFAIGRASRKSITNCYQELEKPGSKWHIHGYVSLVGNIILMMFYTVVSGWMLYYFVKMAKGDFVGQSASQVVNQHGQMMSDPVVQIIFTAIVVILGVLVCMFGVKNSLEKVTKIPKMRV